MNFTTQEIEELEKKMTETDYDEIGDAMIKAMNQNPEMKRHFVRAMFAGFKLLDKHEKSELPLK